MFSQCAINVCSMHVSSWCQTFLLYEPWGRREIVVRLNLIGGQNGGYMSFSTSLKFRPLGHMWKPIPLGHMWRPINIRPSQAVGMLRAPRCHMVGVIHLSECWMLVNALLLGKPSFLASKPLPPQSLSPKRGTKALISA